MGAGRTHSLSLRRQRFSVIFEISKSPDKVDYANQEIKKSVFGSPIARRCFFSLLFSAGNSKGFSAAGVAPRPAPLRLFPALVRPIKQNSYYGAGKKATWQNRADVRDWRIAGRNRGRVKRFTYILPHYYA